MRFFVKKQKNSRNFCAKVEEKRENALTNTRLSRIVVVLIKNTKISKKIHLKRTVEKRKEKGDISMSNELIRAGEIIESYGCEQSNLIAIMQEIQAEYSYLSEAVLTLTAEKLGISIAKVYSVATFYENFSLEPKGKHIIKVCAGTACHVRKSGPIYDAIYDYLQLSSKKKTSADGMFTLETVACLGACGLAPVMTIDGEVHAKMTPDAALALLEEIRKEEAAE